MYYIPTYILICRYHTCASVWETVGRYISYLLVNKQVNLHKVLLTVAITVEAFIQCAGGIYDHCIELEIIYTYIVISGSEYVIEHRWGVMIDRDKNRFLLMWYGLFPARRKKRFSGLTLASPTPWNQVAHTVFHSSFFHPPPS